MRIAVLGSGGVGQALAQGYAAHGHDVVLGTRDPERADTAAWVAQVAGVGSGVAARTFADAAEYGDVVVLATQGSVTVALVETLAAALAGKTVVDATNPLGHGDQGPYLTVTGEDSQGEQVQRALPRSHVVKAYNTVGAPLMVDPELPGGPPTMLIAGDDDAAKATVSELLTSTGWDVADLGGIRSSRYLEGVCMAWVAYGLTVGSWNHAFRLLRG